MDARQILSLRPRLERFLTCFDECFLRREQAAHLRRYVAGQMSDLPRTQEPAAAGRWPPVCRREPSSTSSHFTIGMKR